MDDILVFSKQEHVKHINKILKKLEEHKLSLKPEKCSFDEKEISFLGLIIGQDTIQMESKPLKNGQLPSLKERSSNF